MRPTGGTRAERVAGMALAITCALALVKLGLWLATASLAVLSQALDTVVDIGVLGLAFVAVRLARKPADESHHYGHAKAENLAVFTQVIVLGGFLVAVMVEAVARLAGPTPPVSAPWYALVVMGVSVVVDLVRVRVMTRAARAEGSEALKAGALNVGGDVGTAVVVAISLLLVRTGITAADAWGSLVVGTAVLIGAARLGKRSVDVLMDRAPKISRVAIEGAAAEAPGVTETRRVRVRDTGQQVFADVTVAVGRTVSLERAHDVAEGVEQAIERIAPGADVVVHVEPGSETTGLVEKAQAAASRVEGVHEVHNVLIHAFGDTRERKLHVTLHAKVLPGTSLEQAHGLSERIERAVASELGDGVRVDSHIEPLEPTAPGRDVTARRAGLVEGIQSLALDEVDVLDCHEVLVTESGGELSVVTHVDGRPDLPLDRIHEASIRIEKAIHARFPEVGPVLIHFEPRPGHRP